MKKITNSKSSSKRSTVSTAGLFDNSPAVSHTPKQKPKEDHRPFKIQVRIPEPFQAVNREWLTIHHFAFEPERDELFAEIESKPHTGLEFRKHFSPFKE